MNHKCTIDDTQVLQIEDRVHHAVKRLNGTFDLYMRYAYSSPAYNASHGMAYIGCFKIKHYNDNTL